jgi:carotenoid cleavage dioxygenase-like enzyme
VMSQDALLLRHLSRRAFLKRAGVVAAGLAVGPSFLTGCGNGDETEDVPLAVDPNTPWWLQGNFAPVYDERTDTELPVRGSIPPELNGLYVRNGSNPQKADSPHWFFGDGMVHGVRIENGRALWYRNRYVRTPLYEKGISFGDPGTPPIGGNNQSNVSCVYHAGRLITSGEVGFPYELNKSDLSTIGVLDFDQKLNTSFTAHPKVDPVTGHLHFFGYWFVPPYLTYHVADREGRIIHSQEIEVAKPTMIHSFAITEQDAIFWELPVVFSLEAALQGADNPFSWQPEYGARIGILPLGGLASEIRWVEIEPCYVFHEVNAYRDGDDVVIDVCRHDRMFAGEDLGDTDLTLRRWRVSTGGPQLTFRDEVVTEMDLELPSHDRRFTGRRHRYGWFVTTRDHPDTVDLAGTGFIDYQTGEIRAWDPGLRRHANEALFVPGGSGEGEGWLLTFVYDHVTDTSDLVILDALNVAAGPVAEIRNRWSIRYRAPGPRRLSEGSSCDRGHRWEQTIARLAVPDLQLTSFPRWASSRKRRTSRSTGWNCWSRAVWVLLTEWKPYLRKRMSSWLSRYPRSRPPVPPRTGTGRGNPRSEIPTAIRNWLAAQCRAARRQWCRRCPVSGGFSRAPGPGSGRGVAVFLGLTGALSES